LNPEQIRIKIHCRVGLIPIGSVFSYHNGDHYNSVRRIGDLNARTPSRIKLATLSLQPRAAAVVPNYRDQNNGSCSDSGAGPSDDSGKSHLLYVLLSIFFSVSDQSDPVDPQGAGYRD
jgi:hypothetical protein